MSEKALAIATYCVASGAYVIFGGSSPVSGMPVIYLAFAVIAVGAIGSVVAGIRADRVGRARVAMIAMAVSGTCAVAIGHASTWSYRLTIAVALIWGVSVVADSAQFSACVADVAPREYVGTALTIQTASGFLLTMLTIHFVPGGARRGEPAYIAGIGRSPHACCPACAEATCLTHQRATAGRVPWVAGLGADLTTVGGAAPGRNPRAAILHLKI
jgi:MFS family permease